MFKVLFVVFLLTLSVPAAAADYPWLDHKPLRTLEQVIAPPKGFTRVATTGFGAWLRGLPLLPENSLVMKWDGFPTKNQLAHTAVIDMDVGNQNLQQCADAIMRLRAEWLWSKGRQAEVGKLPGNREKWSGGDWKSYRKYMNRVMAFTGTATMAQAMQKPPTDHKLMPGDVLVQGGHPGHAMLVLDVVVDAHGKRKFMLGQSYMPAQRFHVLRTPGNTSSWFDAEDLRTGLRTLTWPKPFTTKDMRVW